MSGEVRRDVLSHEWVARLTSRREWLFDLLCGRKLLYNLMLQLLFFFPVYLNCSISRAGTVPPPHMKTEFA